MNSKFIIDYVELISLNFHKVVFKPIECDVFFINNIANFIRQSLYFYTEGFAVTEVKIFNISSEYGFIKGLKEDIINLILNIKGIIFKLINKDKIFLRLNSSKNVVYASDIKLNKYVKVLNPNYILCHLSKNSKIDLIMKIEKGRGYIPYNTDKNYRNISHFKDGILLDSFFCPIIKSSYLIENMNNYFHDNLKRLIFFIETNGIISAKDAINYSISSILEQFSNFKIINKKVYNNLINSNFYIFIFDLNFTYRTIKHFINLKIIYLIDILKYTETELLNLDVFITKKTINEILNVLKIYNLHLYK